MSFTGFLRQERALLFSFGSSHGRIEKYFYYKYEHEQDKSVSSGVIFTGSDL